MAVLFQWNRDKIMDFFLTDGRAGSYREIICLSQYVIQRCTVIDEYLTCDPVWIKKGIVPEVISVFASEKKAVSISYKAVGVKIVNDNRAACL